MNYKPMEEQIIYRKVFIHGEEDLPKEDRMWYFGHTTDTNEIVRLRNKVHSDWNYIDWYLLPVPLPSDEEIDKFIEEHPDNTGDLILGAGIAAGFKVGIKWLKSRLTDK